MMRFPLQEIEGVKLRSKLLLVQFVRNGYGRGVIVLYHNKKLGFVVRTRYYANDSRFSEKVYSVLGSYACAIKSFDYNFGKMLNGR